MNLKAIQDKVIVKVNEAEKETPGGIIIANAKNDGVIKAEVYAVGPGKYDNKGKFLQPDVSIGNIILINTMSGQEFSYNDENYVSITNEDIIAILS